MEKNTNIKIRDMIRLNKTSTGEIYYYGICHDRTTVRFPKDSPYSRWTIGTYGDSTSTFDKKQILAKQVLTDQDILFVLDNQGLIKKSIDYGNTFALVPNYPTKSNSHLSVGAYVGELSGGYQLVGLTDGYLAKSNDMWTTNTISQLYSSSNIIMLSSPSKLSSTAYVLAQNKQSNEYYISKITENTSWIQSELLINFDIAVIGNIVDFKSKNNFIFAADALGKLAISNNYGANWIITSENPIYNNSGTLNGINIGKNHDLFYIYGSNGLFYCTFDFITSYTEWILESGIENIDYHFIDSKIGIINSASPSTLIRQY